MAVTECLSEQVPYPIIPNFLPSPDSAAWVRTLHQPVSLKHLNVSVISQIVAGVCAAHLESTTTFAPGNALPTVRTAMCCSRLSVCRKAALLTSGRADPLRQQTPAATGECCPQACLSVARLPPTLGIEPAAPTALGEFSPSRPSRYAALSTHTSILKQGRAHRVKGGWTIVDWCAADGTATSTTLAMVLPPVVPPVVLITSTLSNTVAMASPRTVSIPTSPPPATQLT